jgi:hypothetical protein
MSKKTGRQIETKQKERIDSPMSRMLNAEERSAVTRKIDWTIFAVACLGIAWLHIVLYEHSGAFWRDEASTLHVANAPTVGTMWEWLSKDSAPVLSYAAVRLWIATGLGANDDGLRAFGILISLGIVISLFVSCRTLTGRVPLLATALVAFNSSVFYFGSSLRAYGMAALFIMPCLAAFWRVVQGPTKWNVLASLLLALLSCHSSYQNSYLLFAIGVAGAGACAACRLWRRSLLVLAICFVVAVSMSVYTPAVSAYSDASEIQTYVLPLLLIATPLAEAVCGSNIALLCIWILVTAAGSVSLVFQAIRRHRSTSEETTPCLALYCLIVAVVAGTMEIAFIRIHGFLPHPWHFVPLIALFAVLLEVAFQSPRGKAWIWWARVATALIVIVLSLPDIWKVSLTRRTTLDYVSSILADYASPEDIVLVNPFWLAPGFKYHYHGKAEWNTIPLTSSELDVSASPFAAIKRLMATPNAIEPTLRKIEHTLASGHRVWIVGGTWFMSPDVIPPDPPPAPQTPSGWNCDIYVYAWISRVSTFAQSHATSIRVVPVDTPLPISSFENEPLTVIEGWKGD